MKNFLLKRVVPERLTKTWWVNSLSKKFVLRSLNKNMVILLENGTEKFISILLFGDQTFELHQEVNQQRNEINLTFFGFSNIFIVKMRYILH